MDASDTEGTGVWEHLADRIRGEVLTTNETGYDEARMVWNGLIDHHPVVIVRCTGTADVREAVTLAREMELPVSVKCGGHLTTGEAVRNDGLVIDLSPMNAVRVDSSTQTVRVQGGATWGDVYHETQPFGLLAPGGWDDEVGVGGFTLGGGQGVTVRTEGMACDCLVEVDVVIADGDVVTASETQNQDLFWAIRGGGGNFGVVTSFVFECFELPTKFRTAARYYPLEAGPAVFRHWREVFPTLPSELIPTLAVTSLPEHPEIPETAYGEPGVLVYLVYIGDPDEAATVVDQSLAPEESLLTIDEVVPFLEAFGASPSGVRRHWESIYLDEISDELIEVLLNDLLPFPNQTTTISIFGFGELLERYGPTDTAYAHRESPYQLMLSVNWEDSKADEPNRTWARQTYEALKPLGSGEYLNLQTDIDTERLTAVFGHNLDRLQSIKAKWDPENLFQPAQNVPPVTSE